MGRELKRVPLDFKWPMGKPWNGYLNDRPDTSKECGYCKGTGLTTYGRRLQDRWYGNTELGMPPFTPESNGSTKFTLDNPVVRALAARNVGSSPAFYGRGESALLREAQRLADLFNGRWCHHLNQGEVDALAAAGRLYEFTHNWSKEAGWAPKMPAVVPTAQQVNEWSLTGFGLGSAAQWLCMELAAKRDRDFLTCASCAGEGVRWSSPEAKAAHEAWEPTEPPKGEGFQIWETVSEGSPISPVFATARELAEHMAKTRWGADQGTSVDAWLKFIEGPGWAPSMILADGKLMSGVEAVAR